MFSQQKTAGKKLKINSYPYKMGTKMVLHPKCNREKWKPKCSRITHSFCYLPSNDLSPPPQLAMGSPIGDNCYTNTTNA